MNRREEIVPPTYRNLLMYVDKCKIFVNNGIVMYGYAEESFLKEYNIPYLNTAILMLGKGCSITTEALNILGEHNVTVISTSNKFKAHSITLSEYSGSNTKYFNKLVQLLFIENKRVDLGKKLLKMRESFNEKHISNIIYDLFGEDIFLPKFNIDNVNTIEELLGHEGIYIKELRKSLKDFLFIENNEFTNNILQERYSIGNSLMYGMAATVLNSLGLSYNLNILHGRTNSGSLKYDIADIIKGLVYVTALLSITNDSEWKSDSSEEYVKKLGDFLSENNILKILFDYVNDLIMNS